MIKIEIDNIRELARRDSIWAGLACRMAPELVARKVYEKVAEGLEQKLTELGVEVRVEVDLDSRSRDLRD